MRRLSCLYFIALWVLTASRCAEPARVSWRLHTDSRWIVDRHGHRVKLACVNWASHLEPMVAEGLNKQPVDWISKQIASMGFNCVRLTWPLFMVTNDSLGSMSVAQSFWNLGLVEYIRGIRRNNPKLLDVSLLAAFRAVVSSLGENNVMVILDNHISKPGWCCSNLDGNGFFGDRYFDPNLWNIGLARMAKMFRRTHNVVGMSLRNELRGPRENLRDWFRYMERGAEVVHSANPHVLIIVSGLYYDTDLWFLGRIPMKVSFTRKLVFELHWYASSSGVIWEDGNANELCKDATDQVMSKAGFILNQGMPLFVSEFGGELGGQNVNDDRYFNCFFAAAAKLDFDWALWTIVGSYYLRKGIVGMDEPFGVLDKDFSGPRNASFLQRISALQAPFQGATSSKPTHRILFHPLTGLCVQRKQDQGQLQLGPCREPEAWTHTHCHTVRVRGTDLCMRADQLAKPVRLGADCTDHGSEWKTVSESKMQFSSNIVGSNVTVCLDIDFSTKTIITSPCKCLREDTSCDPASQWFQLVNTTRSTPASR
ncbi:glycosyl hydrolase 5 family protein-like [Rhodamnia argentea]|uniref:Glycosyl hydrolase 5 family protein-like n=1 Tax=Rhodamnia argentea TaxID=178133 RepID=A0A8B8QD43_9MYRT|nr:glycosyl hydrolase 5 family protein-like [Rhodamnia argentea]